MFMPNKICLSSRCLNMLDCFLYKQEISNETTHLRRHKLIYFKTKTYSSYTFLLIGFNNKILKRKEVNLGFLDTEKQSPRETKIFTKDHPALHRQSLINFFMRNFAYDTVCTFQLNICFAGSSAGNINNA